MNALVRWGKFNLVGAVGMGVQLGSLALFNRWAPGHYLYASAAAIEVTLLHNWIWHINYTWLDRKGRDRSGDAALTTQLMRFHLSNGMVSMVGNLALMRVLVEGARMPVLAANGIAIACCSIVNFWLGDRWVFAEGEKGD
jgi:putative flippase GtrA